MVNKMTVFVLVITIMTIMFYYAGLLGSGGTLINILTDIKNYETNWGSILVGLIITVVGVGIGVVTKDPYVGAMGLIVGNYIAPNLFQFKKVYDTIAGESNIIATILFAPFMFLLAMTLIDWWRGRD